MFKFFLMIFFISKNVFLFKFNSFKMWKNDSNYFVLYYYNENVIILKL